MANKNSRVLATGSNQITQHYGNAGHGGCDLVKKTNQLDAITAHSDGTVVWCQSGIPNDQGSSGTGAFSRFYVWKDASNLYLQQYGYIGSGGSLRTVYGRY